jgi:hypothetical protein
LIRRFFAQRRLAGALVLVVVLVVPSFAAAAEPTPIPEGPEANDPPSFIGAPAVPRPVSAPRVPQHPFMAANGRSNIHNDAYQTDTYTTSGPLGNNIQRSSTFFGSECASVTFDRLGRIETVCVGLEGPRLRLLDPDTLELLAEFPLPPRVPNTGGGGNPFTDFSGGGYFYLDQGDRAVIPTTTRHIWVVGQTTAPTGGPAFRLERDYDVSGTVPPGDGIISALPDWSGRIWFVSGSGVVGTVDPGTGAVRSVALGERIGNSFAVDRGGVYIVSDAALYRFEAGAGGAPSVMWRETYANTGVKKPGQTQAGSGTTPTLMGESFVSITDNADPMNIVVYRRARRVTGSRVVCTQPVFEQGAGATDQSLIGTGRSMIVENNYGYTGPTATTDGNTTTPGLERVDIKTDLSGCRTVWHSDEIAPSVVPKLSLANGLVYTYTKPFDPSGTDAWYFTAIDFRTGATVYKRLAGTGLGFNNHYAPVSIGPNRAGFVGTLGGLVWLADE